MHESLYANADPQRGQGKCAQLRRVFLSTRTSSDHRAEADLLCIQFAI